MRVIIVHEGSDDEERYSELAAQAARYGIREHTGIDVGDVIRIDNQQTRADGTERMTFMQLLRLWGLCGGFNRTFDEAHYPVGTGFSGEGWIEAYVGGAPGTIVVGVSPEGSCHS